MRIPCCSLAVALALLTTTDALAVVVAGANGGGDTTNNTTAAQMASQLGLTNASFFNSVVPYSDAGAVYIRWASTFDGNRAFALSAMHITFTNTMVIEGQTYSVTRQSILGSDLALLTLSHTNGIMPNLPVITLATNTPAVGSDVIMAGFGGQRGQAATTNATFADAVAVVDGTGYTSGWPSTLRWGTNRTVDIAGEPTALLDLNGRPTEATKTIFDQPATNGWLLSSEAQGVLGDSGGAMFGLNGDLWGIVVSVSGSDVTDAAFGEATWFADLATYKSTIDSTIGYTLVPEPSTYALLGMSMVLLAGILARQRLRAVSPLKVSARGAQGRTRNPEPR